MPRREREYNVKWVEHRNGLVVACNRKDAVRKAVRNLRSGKLVGGVNDFFVYDATTDFIKIEDLKRDGSN